MPATDIISISLIDAYGKRQTMPIHIAQGTPDSAVNTFVALILGDLENLSEAAVERVQITREIDISAMSYTLTPVAFCNIQKGMNFGFDVEDEDYRHTLRVPAIAPNYVAVDGSATQVANVTAFQGHIATPDIADVATVVVPTSKTGGDIDHYLDSMMTFHK